MVNLLPPYIRVAVCYGIVDDVAIACRIDDLFSTEVSPQKLLSRGIISKDKISVPIYLQAFHDYINANSVWKKTKTLHQDTQPNHDLAETIDILLVKASQHAENQCRRKHTNHWCLELHQHKQKLVPHSEKNEEGIEHFGTDSNNAEQLNRITRAINS